MSALGDTDRSAPKRTEEDGNVFQPPTRRSVVTALAAAGAFGLLPTDLRWRKSPMRSANFSVHVPETELMLGS